MKNVTIVKVRNLSKTSKGITLPKELIEKLDIHNGDFIKIKVIKI